jgi:transcriptional regulator PpsR
MRADPVRIHRGGHGTGALNNLGPGRAPEDGLTPRGTKYWSTGSIPLIAPELLGDIIASASDLAIVVSAEGTVLSALVNPGNRGFGSLQHWEGKDIRDLLTSESVSKLDAQLSSVANGQTTRPAELNHTDGTRWEFPIRYTFHRIGPDGAVLMLGRDLRPVAEMQEQLVKAQLALERDYETQRDFDTRYRVLMDVTQDAMAFVSMSTGRVTDVNTSGAQMLGATREELIGSVFALEFEGRRRSELVESLTALAFNEPGRSMELVTRRNRRKVILNPHLFRAAGERVMLCRIDRADAAEAVPDDLAEGLNALFEAGVDAIVFTDTDGVIRSANASFLKLLDSADMARVKGRSLSDFLVRGGIDLKVLLDHTTRSGQMRMYATRLVSEFDTQTPVEISTTYLSDRQHPAIVMVIRDAGRAEALRKPGLGASDSSVRNVMELVGSATLKDIVAETTDVVEKMCIETAIELTRNNRVAAAEMLGLSRQSLYVKLRKYGLLSRDGD